MRFLIYLTHGIYGSMLIYWHVYRNTHLHSYIVLIVLVGKKPNHNTHSPSWLYIYTNWKNVLSFSCLQRFLTPSHLTHLFCRQKWGRRWEGRERIIAETHFTDIQLKAGWLYAKLSVLRWKKFKPNSNAEWVWEILVSLSEQTPNFLIFKQQRPTRVQPDKRARQIIMQNWRCSVNKSSGANIDQELSA